MTVASKHTIKTCRILPKELPGLDETFGLDESSVLLLKVLAVDFLGMEAGGEEEDGLPALEAGLADVTGRGAGLTTGGASLALDAIGSVLTTGPATANTGFFSDNTPSFGEIDLRDSVSGELFRFC